MRIRVIPVTALALLAGCSSGFNQKAADQCNNAMDAVRSSHIENLASSDSTIRLDAVQSVNAAEDVIADAWHAQPNKTAAAATKSLGVELALVGRKAISKPLSDDDTTQLVDEVSTWKSACHIKS